MHLCKLALVDINYWIIEGYLNIIGILFLAELRILILTEKKIWLYWKVLNPHNKTIYLSILIEMIIC